MMEINSKLPGTAAKELHHMIGWTSPNDFSISEIASSLGIVVKEDTAMNSEGRIIINGNSAIVTLNGTITHPSKKNWVLAHEIGHFLLHKDAGKLFADSDLTLSEWHRKGNHEHQANTFASELLMPERLFKECVTGKKLNLDLIEHTSAYFKTSLLATFLRYTSLGSYPTMLIYIQDGIVSWKQHSNDFPFTYLPLNSKVPAWTVAGDFFYKKRLETKPEQVDVIEWFPEDFQIKYKSNWKLWEQCYQVAPNAIVSCLWPS